jgi:uncharacterized protein YbjT (DUF2867 family)
VARVLIVGCGCRGRVLAAALRERGHVVRGTTRRPEAIAAIEAAGAEAVLADPDRVATVFAALDHISVLVLLLGTARGSEEQLTALFGTRLEMLMHKAIDTTARGVAFEAAGTVPADRLAAGAAVVRGACVGSRIPYAEIGSAPDSASWPDDALAAVEVALAG